MFQRKDSVSIVDFSFLILNCCLTFARRLVIG
jgi:hypothetical protein